MAKPVKKNGQKIKIGTRAAKEAAEKIMRDSHVSLERRQIPFSSNEEIREFLDSPEGRAQQERARRTPGK